MQAKKKERKKGFEEEEKNSHKDLGNATRGICFSIFLIKAKKKNPSSFIQFSIICNVNLHNKSLIQEKFPYFNIHSDKALKKQVFIMQHP